MKRIVNMSEKGYITTKKFNAAINAALNNKPVAGGFLIGPAGTGKTFLAETIASALEAKMHFFQCFPGTREDDLLVKMLPSEKSKSGIALHDGVILKAMKDCQNPEIENVVLILDEWDKTRPSADSFLLDFLQNGRINFNGYSAQLTKDELSKLIVFIPMNDERELSEPLLRRLPMFNFSALSAADIKTALKQTHSKSKYLSNAVILYERCLISRMSKPATIQELRQLLDAIEFLGEEADWDMLVFQYVTKTHENHELLARVESCETQTQTETAAKLQIEAYEEASIPETETEIETERVEMPKPVKLQVDFEKEEAPETEIEEIDSDTTIILRNNEGNYNKVIKKFVDELPDDPYNLADFIKIDKDKIQIKKSIHIVDSKIITDMGLWGQEGEVLFTFPEAIWQDMQILQKEGGLKIVSFSKQKILGFYGDGISVKWTPEKGAEMLVSLDSNRNFKDLTKFNSSYGQPVWLGNKGCQNQGLVYNRLSKEEDKSPEIEEKEVEKIPFFDKVKYAGLKNFEKYSYTRDYILEKIKYIFGGELEVKEETNIDFRNIYFLKQPAEMNIREWNKKAISLNKFINFFDEIRKLDFVSYSKNEYGYGNNSYFKDTSEELFFQFGYKWENGMKNLLDNSKAELSFVKIIKAFKIELKNTEKHIAFLNSTKLEEAKC